MKTPFIALLLSLSLFVPSIQPAFAQTGPQPGTLIKTMSGPAVYWYSNATGRRHAFPNMKTFYSWFSPHHFYDMNVFSEPEVAAIPIGENVTYRPASRLLKITTDPRVYAVERGRTIRWIENERTASALYGPHWQQFIDDVPDAFFVNYEVGPSIATSTSFAPVATLTPDAVIR